VNQDHTARRVPQQALAVVGPVERTKHHCNGPFMIASQVSAERWSSAGSACE
jgi:hypothetical protein